MYIAGPPEELNPMRFQLFVEFKYVNQMWPERGVATRLRIVPMSYAAKSTINMGFGIEFKFRVPNKVRTTRRELEETLCTHTSSFWRMETIIISSKRLRRI